jgi:cytochrome P450
MAMTPIPGPRSRTPLGYAPSFRKNPLKAMDDLHREYGDLVHFRLFNLDVYLLSDPALIQEVLVNQQGNFTKSVALKRAKVLLGEGLLTSEDPLHMRQRRLSQPAFHSDRLKGYAGTMTGLTSEWLARWDADPRFAEGQTVDLHKEIMQLTLSIVSKALYSADVKSEAAAISEAASALVHMFMMLSVPFYHLIMKLPLPVSRRFHASKNRLDKLMYGMIAERRASGVDRGDLLSTLLMAQDAEGEGGGMTDEQLRDEILTLFLAGHETTANALAWTWYLLATNPAAEKCFFAELDSVLAGRAPTLDDVETLRYTYALLAESMRLYPPAWGMGRIAKEDFSMGGYTFPGGSMFFMGQWVMHRDPRYWPDPLAFQPERWLSPAGRPKMAYFPFGAGSRLCIGERFAWMEGVLLLAHIGQRWRFRLAPGARVEPQPLITLRMKYGLPVIPERRA